MPTEPPSRISPGKLGLFGVAGVCLAATIVITGIMARAKTDENLKTWTAAQAFFGFVRSGGWMQIFQRLHASLHLSILSVFDQLVLDEVADFVDHPTDAIVILMDLRFANPAQTESTNHLAAVRILSDQAPGLSDNNLRHRELRLGRYN